MASLEKPRKISRRQFLKRTGWIAAGVTVTVAASYPFIARVIPALPTFADPKLEDGLAWVQVLPGGQIRFFCPRSEMGQGASLGLSQIVAEELNTGQSDIVCVLPDTDQVPPFKMTVGSDSIRRFFDPVSYASARLREALRNLAAQKAGVNADQVKDGQGGFILRDGTAISYASLVPSRPLVVSSAGKAASPPRYAVRRKGNFRAVGQKWKHPDLKAIVTGQATYSRDISLPGMVFAEVLRPPAFGARLKSVDASAAEAMPGITVITVDEGNNFVGTVNFVGVVSTDPFALPGAIEAINVQWEVPEDLNQDQINARLDVASHRDDDDFEHVLVDEGDIAVGARDAKHRNGARYDTPFAAHAAIEPRAAVAWVKQGQTEVWCGTQDPFFVQKRVALLTGRPVDDVIVHNHRMGGGFGGRIQCQASEEAALLSAASGKPVRVQWDREAEFQNNHFQPGFSHFIDAGVTGKGIISHWQHDYVSSPITTGPMPENIAWVMDKVMADFGTSRGSLPPYQLAHQRTRYSDIRTEIPVGAWRGLGAAPNAFAIESMMDELATVAGIDPLLFRLRNLPPGHVGLSGVLRQVAEISGWGRPARPDTGPDTGRGIAGAVYKEETPVAIVAEVLVDHTEQQLKVTKIWCVQDCGVVINPDQVENLVMGNIVWGCSIALKEQISFAQGRAEESNFHTYDILRNHECPDIMVKLADTKTTPVGVGEAALAPVAPAIANAVFAATGQRVRRLPMSYDSIFSGSEA